MTSPNVQLSDATLHRALMELAAGPDAEMVIGDVMRDVAGTTQVRGFAWPTVSSRRAFVLVATGALLVGLVASAFAFSQMQRRPAQSEIVVEQWNGQLGPELVYSHTLFQGGSATGAPLGFDLPADAVDLRWSPDGDRLMYFTREWRTSSSGNKITGIFVADRDGSNPQPVSVSRALDDYAYRSDTVWAPTSERFALTWSTGSCQIPEGETDCMPGGGIEVFDDQGQLVTSIETPDAFGPRLSWSPDGTAIGWHSATCEESLCTTKAFQWRRVLPGASDRETTLDVGPNVGLTWLPDDRLGAISLTDERRVESVYTIATDGSDRRDVAWLHAIAVLSWSPDGRKLMGFDPLAREVIVREIASGTETRLVLPENLSVRGWSPEGDRIVLDGEGTTILLGGERYAQYRFYMLNVDGSGEIQDLGDGEDFTWLPPADD